MNAEGFIRAKRLAACAVVVGIALYLSKLSRGYFAGDPSALFVLGFLPNLGLSFAIPFIYMSNRARLMKPMNHFGLACFVTLALMMLNEVRDQYQTGRVFDLLDIYASIAGVILAYLLFRVAILKPPAPGADVRNTL